MDFKFIISLLSSNLFFLFISEKRMTQVWASWETYRRLLAVRGKLRRRESKIRNLDETIGELIAFWKECSRVLEELELWLY